MPSHPGARKARKDENAAVHGRVPRHVRDAASALQHGLADPRLEAGRWEQYAAAAAGGSRQVRFVTHRLDISANGPKDKRLRGRWGPPPATLEPSVAGRCH